MSEAPYWRELQSTFDLIAEDFDRSRRTPWREVVAFLERLPTRARLLDIGCGNGRHMIPHLDAGGWAAGVDVSPRLLAIAGCNLEDYDGWSLAIAVATRIPFASRSVDAVVCTATLHHILDEGDRLAAAAEMRRVLRPRGVALLSCWAYEQERFTDLESPDVDLPWTLPDGTRVMRSYHLFRDGELEGLATAAGLTVDRSFRSGGNYYVELSNLD